MSADAVPTRVVAIGVGGATSSGKTTLAKHIQRCLPASFLIHQDDFVPPEDQLPIDPAYPHANWDDAPGAVDWDRLARFLGALKASGAPPPGHRSYDALNAAPAADAAAVAVAVDEGVLAGWRARCERLAAEHLERRGARIAWAVVDGFLLYWDERVAAHLDVRAFLRVEEEVARTRRAARAYHTPEGAVWRDPPSYWEKIAWPAYLRAHAGLFAGGDVVRGALSGAGEGVLLLEGAVPVREMLDAVMAEVVRVSESESESGVAGAAAAGQGEGEV